jgi:hypothetical protein
MSADAALPPPTEFYGASGRNFPQNVDQIHPLVATSAHPSETTPAHASTSRPGTRRQRDICSTLGRYMTGRLMAPLWRRGTATLSLPADSKVAGAWRVDLGYVTPLKWGPEGRVVERRTQKGTSGAIGPCPANRYARPRTALLGCPHATFPGHCKAVKAQCIAERFCAANCSAIWL